jgi:NAD(P)-dependent dehydrogenase (short-subunit alcohol dehydrogenase family)
LSKRIEGKIALITGGGSGIGKETSLLLAKEGATVIVTDINVEAAQETARVIEKRGGNGIAIAHDVTSETEWENVVAEVVRQFERIDILFNNAGIYIIQSLRKTTLEEWNKLMNVNVTGVFLGMKHVAPLMREQGGGSIVNISSTVGLQGAPGHTLYGASKGAVRAMTKSVAMEYAPANVRVNSLHPGYLDTGMAEYGAEASKTTIDELGEQLYPLGRIGERKDAANAVLFLASDESAYMTGSELVIDGGAHAAITFSRKKK